MHVGDPVAYAPAAAEGNYDELVGCVGCDEAGYVGGDAVLKFRERGGVCWWQEGSVYRSRGFSCCPELKLTCFYAGAVSLWASDFSVGAVVVAETVGCGGVLGKEFQLGENGRGHG